MADPSDAPDAHDDPDAYRTLAGRGRAEFVVNGSEFLGHAAPAPDVQTAEAFVASVRDEYPDATHNVPAYRVRADPFREYSSDDGEPSGSAGKPILNVLSGQDLENVVVVVTRYYGGTNLGVGGLVRAYGQAAKLAVEDAGVTTEVPHERVRIVVDYDDSGTVRGLVESTASEFDATYEARVSFDARVPTRAAAAFRDRVRSATSGRAEFGDEND
ncbi:IMPACT family protein [Salinirubellus salinus]|uniref:IMPACT family protein n=1 Tax=Salinirubellus salinus TaxID=1364945 RepID=A0A9E7R1Q5_9EURY|nr:YigZ family protein [Salinirubellus salinus]UWM54027.1 IMPACT family protein [Salinirubellus salinus]